MTQSNVKDNILHSLGTLSAVGLVYEARLSAYEDPTGEQVNKIILDTIGEFERGFVSQISS